jgi:uncharacterized protein (TIGR03435 family)
MKQLLTSVSLTVFAAFGVLGQSTVFDVVSVKPSDPSTRGMQIGISPGGRFTATNATVKALIQQAYDVREFQISGGPGWIGTERYDIVAKADDSSISEDDLRKMNEEQRKVFQDKLRQRLRTLLADRFQLKARKETKELPIYALVVAKNGPRIQLAKDDGSLNGGIRANRSEAGKTEIIVTKAPLTMLVQVLSNMVGRTVLDKTDLQGNFDFKLTFAPDLVQQTAGAGDVDADGPSLFTALQEQAGLKLDAQKGPVEIVVVESVEKASEN